MHIPDSMLHGAICPVTAAVGAAGVGAAVMIARRSQDKPSAAGFAAVTAVVFSLQMLNFPVASGTSGHVLGGTLAVVFLGVPWAVLSMSLVLAVQAFFFADGGVNALGANVINMGLIGAGAAGLLLGFLNNRGLNKMVALMVASLVSVLAAAVACSVEVSVSGVAAWPRVLAAMVSAHVLIGLGEAALTVVLVAAIRCWGARETIVTMTMAVAAVLVSPLASRLPDGLEWVALKLFVAPVRGVEFNAVWFGYQIPGVNGSLSTIMAGLAGVVMVAGLSWSLARVSLGTRQIK